MFKMIWNLIKLVLILAVLAIVFQQFTARFLLTFLLRTDLGVPVEVEEAQVDLLKAQIKFRNVEIWNPDGFPPGVMVYFREITADSEWSRLFSNGGLHFDRLELDVDNLKLVQPADGRLNFLSTRLYRKQDGFSFLKNMQIDDFVLSIGRVSFHDEGRGGDAGQEIDMRRMSYRKVHSLRDVMDILGWEVLRKMRLENLGAGYLDQIGSDLDGAGGRKSFDPPKAAVWH